MYCVLLNDDEKRVPDLWNYLLPKSTKDVLFLHATQPIDLVYINDNDSNDSEYSVTTHIYILHVLYIVVCIYSI